MAFRIESDLSLLGEARMCALMVEAEVLRGAQSLLAQAELTDAELDFLATGHLSCDDARE